MIGGIPLQPTPAEIQWLGTAAWTFELGRDGCCWQRRSGWAVPEKVAVDTAQDRMTVPVQDIQPAAGGDQAVGVMRPEAGEVASVLEPETENTRGSSSVESEGGVVGGEVAREEGLVKGEVVVVVAVGQDSLIGREDIQHGLDKTIVEAHDGKAPSESVPEEEGARGKTDYMKVGRGERVGREVEGDRFGVRLGRHSGSGHGSLEAKRDDHGDANMRFYG